MNTINSTNLTLDYNLIKNFDYINQYIYNKHYINHKYSFIKNLNQNELTYLISKCLETNNKEICYFSLNYLSKNFNINLHEKQFYYSKKNKYYRLSSPQMLSYFEVLNWCS